MDVFLSIKGDFKKNEANATILIKENIKGFLNT